MVPPWQMQVKLAARMSKRVSSQAVQSGIPVILEIAVQPYMLLQNPLTTSPLGQTQLVVPMKPVLQLVQLVVEVQAWHPVIFFQQGVQDSIPSSTKPTVQGHEVPDKVRLF